MYMVIIQFSLRKLLQLCNEALLNDYLLKTIEDPKKRIYLLNHWLEGFRGTVFRQTMFAEFEHIIHQLDQDGEALTAEKLTEEYYELNQKILW